MDSDGVFCARKTVPHLSRRATKAALHVLPKKTTVSVDADGPADADFQVAGEPFQVAGHMD